MKTILVKKYTPNKKDTKLWKKRFSVRTKMISGQQILKWLDEEKQMVGWRATNAEMYITTYINNAFDRIANKVKRYDDKAPRTGATPPTEKEKKEFAKLFKCKKCKSKKVRSSKGLVCSKCDIK